MAAVLRHRRRRAERNFRARRESLDDMRDVEVVERYRLSRGLIMHLAEILHEDLVASTDRGHPVAPITTILMSLRYLAKGDFYSEVGDLHGVSKSTMTRLFNKFLSALNRRLNNIQFPVTRVETEANKLSFYQKCRIPGVVGAVDGTLIPIKAPSQQEPAYVCRKGFHALNVQGVVDNDMIFTHIVARWPGSQHDANIFNMCALKDYLETNNIGHLLGDSGYPLRRYLLVPKLNAASPKETSYNTAHARGRVVVERAFGLLKSRFRCLHRSGGCLPFAPEKCTAVVTACVRLHNMCRRHGVAEPDDPGNNLVNDIANDHVVADVDHNAILYRQNIINTF